MDQNYRIRIGIGEKSLEIESTDKDWLEKQKGELSKLLRLYEGVEVSSGRMQKDKPARATASERAPLNKMTINEFYRRYCTGLKSTPDKAVFFVYYLSWVENKKNVTSNEVKELFIRAGIPKANDINVANVLARAKQRALVNYIDNAWSLTITGEDFVVNRIQEPKDE